MNIGRFIMRHQDISLFIIVILVYLLFRLLFGTSFEIAALASLVVGTHMISSYERFRIYKAISNKEFGK